MPIAGTQASENIWGEFHQASSVWVGISVFNSLIRTKITLDLTSYRNNRFPALLHLIMTLRWFQSVPVKNVAEITHYAGNELWQ